MGIFTSEAVVQEGCCPSCHQIFGGCWCSASDKAAEEARKLNADDDGVS